MNERIKELAHQAERLAEDELAHLERVHNRLYSFTEGREIYNQKFAELIIRGCAGIAAGYDSPSRDIKEHFGVEE